MLSEQEIIRREKLTKLKELGINPYPAPLYPVNTTSKDILTHYEEGKEVIVAGRLMSLRVQGKASFATLQDSEGSVQLYFNRDEMCPDEDKTLYNEVFKKLLDLGDFIGVEGYMFITKMGEKTIAVKNFTLLSKVLRPLPMPKVDAEGKVHDAFTDPEQRYRMRYVDLVVNPQVKEVFIKRTKLFNAMRQFFNDAGYFEVETPILQSIPGGAAARPFITHHNALDIPLYLRIANELYLKRLIVGGFDGVYEFSKNFRNEGMDRTHNPEFTSIEFYWAYHNYHDLMGITEDLFNVILEKLGMEKVINFDGMEIDFSKPFKRISYKKALVEIGGLAEDVVSDKAKILAKLRADGFEANEKLDLGHLQAELFDNYVESKLIHPTFVIDYPISISPLSRRSDTNPDVAERFELFIAGRELANGFNELNDPIDQYNRFKAQIDAKNAGDDEAHEMDEDYVKALGYGMPPVAGEGIGIDRLVMLLTDKKSIRDVVLFPAMRPLKTETKENEK